MPFPAFRGASPKGTFQPWTFNSHTWIREWMLHRSLISFLLAPLLLLSYPFSSLSLPSVFPFRAFTSLVFVFLCYFHSFYSISCSFRTSYLLLSPPHPLPSFPSLFLSLSFPSFPYLSCSFFFPYCPCLPNPFPFPFLSIPSLPSSPVSIPLPSLPSSPLLSPLIPLKR